MPLISQAAQDASLAMSYGASRHSTLSLATFEVALFDGDPAVDGVELDTAGGYAAVTVNNDGTTWPDAPSVGAIVSAPIAFATSTAGWTSTRISTGTVPAVASHWAIRNPSTSDLWDSMPLPGDGVSVETAGVDVRIQLVIPYADPSQV